MGRYAEETTVSVEDTRSEIEKTLTRYGADSFMFGSSAGAAIIAFEAHRRKIKFQLRIPSKDDPEFTTTPERGIKRSADKTLAAWEQGKRQRWRALLLQIKAKLEAVESGIATFEQEFLAYTVLPGGQTVGELTAPQIEDAYRSGRVPPLLLGGST